MAFGQAGQTVHRSRFANHDAERSRAVGRQEALALAIHFPAGLILTPKSKGAFQISGLLNGKDEGSEHFILFASPDEVALPIIVRSRHSEFRIWRFIPDNAIKPGSVQRVVATLEVTK